MTKNQHLDDLWPPLPETFGSANTEITMTIFPTKAFKGKQLFSDWWHAD